MAKTARLEVRLEPEGLERVKAAARSSGLSASAWAGERLLLCANQELVTVPPPPSAEELRRRPVEERVPHATKVTGVPEPQEPSIDPADEALVLEVLGDGCLLCSAPGRVVPANREMFREGRTGPSNLQVLCDGCAEGAGDLRDHDQIQRIKAATARP